MKPARWLALSLLILARPAFAQEPAAPAEVKDRQFNNFPRS